MEAQRVHVDIGGENVYPSNMRQTDREVEKYIIENNKMLNAENLSLRNDIIELKKQIESKDDEIDRYDERIRYIKGLLQNLNSIRHIAVEIAEKRSSMCDDFKILCERTIVIDKHVITYIRSYLVSSCFIFVVYAVYHIFSNSYEGISYLLWIILYQVMFYTFWHMFCSFVTNLVYRNISKEKVFMYNPFKISGHINFQNDYHICINRAKTTQHRVREISKELQTIEESCLTLDHWIADV